MSRNLEYELLIRRAWKCDRFQKGANTDTFEALISDEINSSEQPYNDKAHITFKKNFLKVKRYLINALNKAIQRLKDRGDEQESIDRVLDCILLVNAAETTKQLSQAIRSGLDTFIELNLGFEEI